MSLKQIIKRSKILNPAVGRELEMPGEPMIYSVKYPVGQRTRGVQFFRNMKWKSLLKTFFRSFYRTTIPIAIEVRFFVSPPVNVKVSPKILRQESMPAVMSYELCDYTLSFLEMLHHVLFNSYRQVVKLDVIKIYSSNPRTVVKFMKWDEYVKLQGSNTNNSEAQGISADESRQSIQSKCKGNAGSLEVCEKEVLRKPDASTEGTTACDSAFCSPCASQPPTKKTRSAKIPTSLKEAGRGQPREVS
jgi:hypothetical protein